MGKQHDTEPTKAAPAPDDKPAEENTTMPQTTSNTKTARTSRRPVKQSKKAALKVIKHPAKKAATTKSLKPLDPNRITLRAELNAILKAAKGHTMSVYHLAQKVSERKRFKKRDGRTEVTTQQVYTTAKNAAADFKMKGTQVTLVS